MPRLSGGTTPVLSHIFALFQRTPPCSGNVRPLFWGLSLLRSMQGYGDWHHHAFRGIWFSLHRPERRYLNVAAGGGFEPPITGSKPVAVTAWLPGCVSLFRADGAAFACHAESGKRTADIRLSLREEFLCACTTSWTRAPLRIHPSKQRLFTFQSGGRGGIRTHGCFHIGGFQDRCLHPLGNPSFWFRVRDSNP